VQEYIFYSVANLQKLVKGVENRRKFRKLQNQFVGFSVKNTTTFVILTWSDSGYF
jgi:hypothetical protein